MAGATVSEIYPLIMLEVNRAFDCGEVAVTAYFLPSVVYSEGHYAFI